MAVSWKFQQYDLRQLTRGAVVVVELSTAANVRLMRSTELSKYKAGKDFRVASGSGLVKRSPHRMAVPATGHWVVVVDRVGLKPATVRSNAYVEPAAPPVARSLPEASPAFSRAPMSSLTEIRHEPASALAPDAEGRTWDVFISHASEDKDEVARPLKDSLEREGLTVWLDETTLRIGDSLRQKIDEGLTRSSFGVVILSSAYFTKGWTVYELDAIIGQSVSGTQRLLPIWHGLTKSEVAAKSPTLADRLARTTATSTIDEIATEIALVVGEAKTGIA